MNVRLLLAAVFGLTAWNYLGTGETLPGVPGLDLNPERLRNLWTLAIAIAPLFGPKGVTISQWLIKLAGIFDKSIISNAEDWGAKIEEIGKMSPILLDLLKMFQAEKTSGASPERLRDLGDAIQNEIARVTAHKKSS